MEWQMWWLIACVTPDLFGDSYMIPWTYCAISSEESKWALILATSWLWEDEEYKL